MSLNTTKFFNTDEVYISSRMNEYLKKNFGYEVGGDLDTLKEAKESLEVKQQELKNHNYMSDKYMENMLMIETISALLKAHGSDRKSSIIEEDDSNSDMSESVNEEDVTLDNEGNIAGYLDYIDECIDQIGPDNVSEMAYRIQNAVDDIRTRELNLKASVIRDKFNENDDEELINKVAEWIYHNSSEPISEIEYLLKKSGAVGDYMDAVSESKEKVTEDDEEEKGPDHYRWKNDSQLAVVIGRLEGAMDELDNAIQYRGENSAKFFNNGDKAGVGNLMGIKQKLEDIHSDWNKNTEYYGM